jgi:hypothetical protein
MNQYLINTKYAVSNIIDLIIHDEKEIEKLQGKYSKINDEFKLYYEKFGAVRDMSYNLNSIQIQYEPLQLMEQAKMLQEQAKNLALRMECLDSLNNQLNNLILQLECLKESIDAKSVAISSLCGALLQIAKQGISIVYRGSGGCLAICPDGRSIGNEVLKNIIWQGRNQSMHYEEGNFKAPVQQCFQNLEAYFGNEFSLSLHPNENFAQKIVINIFGWNDYQVYEYDMISILG